MPLIACHVGIRLGGAGCASFILLSVWEARWFWRERTGFDS